MIPTGATYKSAPKRPGSRWVWTGGIVSEVWFSIHESESVYYYWRSSTNKCLSLRYLNWLRFSARSRKAS